MTRTHPSQPLHSLPSAFFHQIRPIPTSQHGHEQLQPISPIRASTELTHNPSSAQHRAWAPNQDNPWVVLSTEQETAKPGKHRDNNLAAAAAAPPAQGRLCIPCSDSQHSCNPSQTCAGLTSPRADTAEPGSPSSSQLSSRNATPQLEFTKGTPPSAPPKARGGSAALRVPSPKPSSWPSSVGKVCPAHQGQAAPRASTIPSENPALAFLQPVREHRVTPAVWPLLALKIKDRANKT